MTERDFDKIFQDKIGDELPFEFQPADWLAAEQELDKVMPIAAPIAPVVRLLTWHKWVAAAAVLLLASQLFLVSELRNIKQEVVSLHQENMTLKAPQNTDAQTSNIAQNTVFQYDTIVKKIIFEVPHKDVAFKKELKVRGVEKVDFDNFVANKNTINEQYEASISNKKRLNTEGSSQPNLTTKNNENVVLNNGKILLQTVENSDKTTVQKEDFATVPTLITSAFITQNTELIELNRSLIELNKLNKNLPESSELKDKNEALIGSNRDLINRNNALIDANKGQLMANELINKNVELINLNRQLIDFNKDKSIVNDLPNLQLMAVQSINRNKNWLDDTAFDFIATMKKLPIIKPISMPNGWEIGVNSLFLINEDHRRQSPQSGPRDGRKDEQLSVGVNLRLAYNVRRNLRLSAEIDFWSEQHAQDTGRFKPPVTPTDFTFVSVEQLSRSWQIRIGTDYKFRQIIGLQPFIGVGLAYQTRSNDEFEYKLRKGNDIISPRLANDKPFKSPLSLDIRAGVEGKIYRRLSWSFDVNAQRSTTLSSHIGLKYAL